MWGSFRIYNKINVTEINILVFGGALWEHLYIFNSFYSSLGYHEFNVNSSKVIQNKD